MKKRIKWTYEAELDYILEFAPREWVIGFLDQEGNPYECPHTRDEALIRKLEKLGNTGKKLRVTVEVDEKLDASGKQHPKLLDVCVLEQ
jgi:hypothetical protein